MKVNSLNTMAQRKNLHWKMFDRTEYNKGYTRSSLGGRSVVVVRQADENLIVYNNLKIL